MHPHQKVPGNYKWTVKRKNTQHTVILKHNHYYSLFKKLLAVEKHYRNTPHHTIEKSIIHLQHSYYGSDRSSASAEYRAFGFGRSLHKKVPNRYRRNFFAVGRKVRCEVQRNILNITSFDVSSRTFI